MTRLPVRRGVLAAVTVLTLAGCAAAPPASNAPPPPQVSPAQGSGTPAPASATPSVSSLASTSAATPTASTATAAGRITVDPPVTRADEPASIRLSGFKPATEVTVVVTTVGEAFEDPGGAGGPNEASATFVTDAAGNVDLARQAPKAGGSYDIPNAMGLFWSVKPVSSPSVPITVEALPATANPGAYLRYRYQVTAVVDGSVVATTTLDKDLGSPDVAEREIAEDGVVGQFYLPPGAGPFPAVIVLSGTSGGITLRRPKAFAARGYAVLSLPYFGYDSPLGATLPGALDSIPLEYFTGAITWLQGQPMVDPDRIGFYGLSYGGTVALEVAAHDPRVKAVVAVSPPTIVWGGDLGNSSLTWQGKPLPWVDALTAQRFRWPSTQALAAGHDATKELRQAVKEMKADPDIAAATIPVERAKASILIVTGAVDSQIPGPLYGALAVDRLDSHHYRYPYQQVLNMGAGHLVDFPFIDRSIEARDGGGDRVSNELASEKVWPLVLGAFAAMQP